MSVRGHVIHALSRKTGRPEADIRGQAHLVTGLGLDGDDAAEFFEALRAEFGTDLTALKRDWSRHFRPELTLFNIFTRHRTLVPITVEEVVRAVERGRW